MAKIKGFLNKIAHEPVFHKTSIGRRPSLQKMNKNKRKNLNPTGAKDVDEIYIDNINMLTTIWKLYATHGANNHFNSHYECATKVMR